MFGDRFCFWKSHIAATLIMLCCLIFSVTSAKAQTTSFTYQGRLTDGGNAANGTYDLQFALFDGGGVAIGATLTRPGTSVSGGIFTVQLDFGVSAFPGADRFLEISVRPSGGGSFTILSPRQQISSTPYAIRTLSATTADGLSSACVGCVQDSQINAVTGSKVTGTIPAASVPDLSASYIKNTNSQQGSSNFNISGNGTAGGTLNGNVVNATTQYNLGGQRLLSGNSGNLFAGALAGPVNTSGTNNVFVGPSAGRSNTMGSSNSFFGFNAGFSNVGDNAGNGNGNSFFGSRAGNNNTGSLNSFFGAGAGLLNATGSSNSFFGANAGSSNSGSGNNFFGVNAGNNNVGGDNNFFGYQAGLYHTNGSYNSYFGSYAGQGDSNGSFTSFNSIFGALAGESITTGMQNSFFGDLAGHNITTGDNNSFFGYSAGLTNSTGYANTFVGVYTGSGNTQVSNSTAIGYNATVNCDHCMVLGDANDSSLRVGIGTSSPGNSGSKLAVDGGSSIAVKGVSSYIGLYGSSFSGYGVYGDSGSGTGYAGYFDGKALVTNHLYVGAPNGQVMLTVASIPPGGSFANQVCFTAAGDLLQCTSSLRYKSNVHPFLDGLNIVRRLRPINFNWKQDGQPDIGLGAEDVAKVAPEFVSTNSKGEIVSVKYAQLSAVFINAIKEQQAQIENLRAQNAALSARLHGVEKVLRRKAHSTRRLR